MNRFAAEPRFALCVRNADCEDLELRKVYAIIPDKRAKRDGYVRVVDESGEDYLYPESYFVLVKLSRKAQEAVATSVRGVPPNKRLQPTAPRAAAEPRRSADKAT